MAGTVYLRTNQFEVKLEGITFRTKDFESLCTLDFLFAEGKTWAHKPIVGLDIIRHPRNPKIILLLLCIGTGCVILRLHAGRALPDPIIRFLRDERINFVGFGIQEKGDIFPLKEFGFEKKFLDVSYLAAKRFNDSKYRRSKLGELARKILGIKKMVGLTDESSFERYEVIKCAICQLFITSVIGMALLGSKDKKKMEDVPKKMTSFKLEEWFNNVPKVEKKEHHQLEAIINHFKHKINPERKSNVGDQNENRLINKFVDDSLQSRYKGDFLDDQGKGVGSKRYNEFVDGSLQSKCKGDFCDNLEQIKGVQSKRYSDSFTKMMENYSSDDSNKTTSKTPLKGILKCPSTNTNKNNTTKIQMNRANSKGLNVSFAFN